MATRVRVQSDTQIRMIKTRADGTQVDLGVVSAEYANPVRQWWWRTVGKRRADARIRKENHSSGG